jgi:hypothetical protein
MTKQISTAAARKTLNADSRALAAAIKAKRIGDNALARALDHLAFHTDLQDSIAPEIVVTMGNRWEAARRVSIATHRPGVGSKMNEKHMREQAMRADQKTGA